MPDKRPSTIHAMQLQAKMAESSTYSLQNRFIQKMSTKKNPVQRAEEEEPLQGKFKAIQRAEEELLQGKFSAIQRAEEEEPLQGKFVAIQRVEEEEPLQGKFATAQLAEEEEPLQGKFKPLQRAGIEEKPLQQASAKANDTGLPHQLKAGIERLSGVSMDHVKVHYNSAEPAQLNAHTYAQASDIHVAPIKEKHLPHDAWHLVQQAQGRVKPRMQMKEGVPINDDQGLEQEADVMGAKALAAGQLMSKDDAVSTQLQAINVGAASQPVQREILLDGVAADISALLASAADVKERIIIANWEWTDTKHNFKSSTKASAQEALDNAIASAKAQVIEVPALYSAANLKFVTKADDRLATLYFISGSVSGRIRQQHGSGPVVISQSDKVDYFFADKDGMNKFNAAAKKASSRGADFEPKLADYGATLVPTAGHNHFEITYSGKKVAKRHPSGGIVDPDVSAYDDNRIKSIYQGVIGYTTYSDDSGD